MPPARPAPPHRPDRLPRLQHPHGLRRRRWVQASAAQAAATARQLPRRHRRSAPARPTEAEARKAEVSRALRARQTPDGGPGLGARGATLLAAQRRLSLLRRRATRRPVRRPLRRPSPHRVPNRAPLRIVSRLRRLPRLHPRATNRVSGSPMQSWFGAPSRNQRRSRACPLRRVPMATPRYRVRAWSAPTEHRWWVAWVRASNRQRCPQRRNCRAPEG